MEPPKVGWTLGRSQGVRSSRTSEFQLCCGGRWAGQGMAPVSWPGLSEMRCVVTAEAAQPTLSPILLHDPSHLIDT